MVLRALAHFLLQLATALAIAAGIAAIWALARGGEFGHAFGVACLLFGGLALLFGAFGVGGMSPSLGLIENAGRGGTNPLPGMPAFLRTSPGATAVNATAIFFITGIAMVVIGSSSSARDGYNSSPVGIAS